MIILVDTPCGNDCPTSDQTGFFDRFLSCDGTCKTLEEEGPAWYFENGKLMRRQYKGLCDGVCQSLKTPCHEKCQNVRKFSNLECDGTCGDPDFVSGNRFLKDRFDFTRCLFQYTHAIVPVYQRVKAVIVNASTMQKSGNVPLRRNV